MPEHVPSGGTWASNHARQLKQVRVNTANEHEIPHCHIDYLAEDNIELCRRYCVGIDIRCRKRFSSYVRMLRHVELFGRVA